MTATGGPVTFYCVVGDGPDGHGRHRFDLFWWGYHPATGHGVRGQVFRASLAESRRRTVARGDRWVVVGSTDVARRRAAEDGRPMGTPVVLDYVSREGSVEPDVHRALAAKRDARDLVLERHRDGAASCPFHPDRAQVRNGMCADCAEKADDAL